MADLPKVEGIRPVTHEDLDSVINLWSPPQENSEYWAGVFQTSVGYVCVENGVVVGFAHLRLPSNSLLIKQFPEIPQPTTVVKNYEPSEAELLETKWIISIVAK
jgi:hypothetical protein